MINSIELRNKAAGTAPGKTLPITIVRDGKEQTLNVTLTEFKEKKAVKKMQYNNVLKGITVQEVNASVRDKLDLPAYSDRCGRLPMSPRTALPRAALQPSDLILEVNRKEIKGLADYDQVSFEDPRK